MTLRFFFRSFQDAFGGIRIPFGSFKRKRRHLLIGEHSSVYPWTHWRESGGERYHYVGLPYVSLSFPAHGSGISRALWSSLAFLAITILVVRLWHVAHGHLRLAMTIDANEKQQRYWSRNPLVSSNIQKHLVNAPLLHKRHNREIQLSQAVGVGTLPSRLHTILLLIYLLSNVAYCSLLNYHHQSRAALIAEFRGRSGHLAVINMLGLFLFAARNNPFISLLGISFDTFNLFHRWIGRIVVLESVAHAIAWFLNKYDALGWAGIRSGFMTDPFLQYGLLSSIAMILIFVQTPSPIRHAFYEIFLHLHQLLAATALVGITLHVKIQSLPQVPIVYTIIGVWALERSSRLLRLLYHNVSRQGTTKVHVEALEGGACRATFCIPGSWTENPGHHVFAYIPGISLWMSHPFSVAWVQPRIIRGDRSLAPSTDSDTNLLSKTPLPLTKNQTLVSCVMATRTGMTRSLYQAAHASSTNSITLRAFIEGPYYGSSSGLASLRSYGTVLLFAGGVGITNQISHVRDLRRGFEAGLCATQKVVLVWSVRSFEQLEWVRGWMEELVDDDKNDGGHGNCGKHLHPNQGPYHRKQQHKQQIFKILPYVTQRQPPTLPPIDHNREDSKLAAVSQEVIQSPYYLHHKIHRGRPNIQAIVENEFEDRIGAMSIGVCGPGALADDVRCATRKVMGRGNVGFWEEAFTW